MHLLFDGQPLQSPESRHRGIGRFAYCLLAALREARPDWAITVVEIDQWDSADRQRMPAGLHFANYSVKRPNYSNRPNRWRSDRDFGDWISRFKPDAYLSVSAFEEGVMPIFSGDRPPTFVVLHDLIPLVYHEIYLTDPNFLAFYTQRLQQLCAADVLLADSHCTAQDYRRFLPAGPAAVVMSGGAPDASFAPLPLDRLREIEPRVRERLGLRREFILQPSGQCWRKNSGNALLAYIQLPRAIRERFDFVVACKIDKADQEELIRIANEHGVGQSLRLTGFVSDDELRALYQLSRLTFFPSYYEGLGLPVVEALRCGAPVVTSDASSLPEYGGSVSHYGDPADVQSLGSALLAALEEPRDQRRDERIAFASGFTWRKTAERAAQEMERFIGQELLPKTGTGDDTLPRFGEGPGVGFARPRIAWIMTALPDTRAFDRAEILVDYLTTHYSVEIVVPDDHPGANALLHAKAPLIRFSELAVRHRVVTYNRFIYHWSDDGPLDTFTRLAQKFPGLLLMDAPHPSAAVHQLIAGRWRRARSRKIESAFLAVGVFDSNHWSQFRLVTRRPVYLLDAEYLGPALLLAMDSLPPLKSIRRRQTISRLLPRWLTAYLSRRPLAVSSR